MAPRTPSRMATAVVLSAALAVPEIAAGQSGLGDLGANLFKGIAENAEKMWEQRDRLLGKVSAEEERALGRAARAVLLGAAPPIADERAQRYVARVGRWLALHTEQPDLEWRFAIIDADTVNAFATPGGGVLITRGLFLLLGDESELAGVLAHEMAHVLARHHVRAMISEARVGLLTEIARDAAAVDGPLPEALLEAGRGVYASGLGQGEELEADRMGAVIAARAGYDPFGLYRVLGALAAAGEDPELLGFFLATHPAPAARLDALDAALPASFDALGGATPERDLGARQARLPGG